MYGQGISPARKDEGNTTMSSKKKTVAKSETYTEAKNKEALQKASSVTIEAAAKKVTEAQLAIGKTLSDVTNQLQTQLSELDTVSQAVLVKQSELETIYGKEKVLKSIDDLELEREQHKRDLDDEKQNLERQRQQEMADYQFNLEQSRKAADATFEDADRIRKNHQRDEDETREKAFQAREEILKKQEAEIADLRAKAAAFPDEMKKEVDKQVAIVSNSIKKDFTHQLEMARKDFETSQIVSRNTIQSLNDRLANSDKIITELTAQLNSAQAKVSEIAKEALQAASNTKSLADVQAVLQTQSNGASQRKA